MEELETKAFKTEDDFEKWLSKNHDKAKGLWIRFYKKESKQKSINYDQALDVALCHGWIDGQLKKYDENSWLHRFTPRRAKSGWSKKNTEHVERLIKAGRMETSGLNEIERAKQDGRWQSAYDSPSKATIPEDFMKRLKKNKPALEFFNTLNKANTYAIAYRLQKAAKPETREKWVKKIIEMLENHETFH